MITHADASMVAAIAGAVCALTLLILVILIARVGAFSRHVDQRGVRRAKFQDEWSGVISAADERARELSDRMPK